MAHFGCKCWSAGLAQDGIHSARVQHNRGSKRLGAERGCRVSVLACLRAAALCCAAAVPAN